VCMCVRTCVCAHTHTKASPAYMSELQRADAANLSTNLTNLSPISWLQSPKSAVNESDATGHTERCNKTHRTVPQRARREGLILFCI